MNTCTVLSGLTSECWDTTASDCPYCGCVAHTVGVLLQVTKALIDMENMFELLATEPRVQDEPHAATLQVSSGTVEFKQVREGAVWALVLHSGDVGPLLVSCSACSVRIRRGTWQLVAAAKLQMQGWVWVACRSIHMPAQLNPSKGAWFACNANGAALLMLSVSCSCR